MMPKRKSAARRTATPARKKAAAKKAVKRPRPAKKAAKKSASTNTRRGGGAVTKGPATKKEVRKRRLKLPKSLGRPILPSDARLDIVFQKDYQAREVFHFLGVQTIRELEQYAPAEIVDRLTNPMVQTVERIRKSLALNNRCLARDRDFAVNFQKQWKSGRR
jgi:hypothetical protein